MPASSSCGGNTGFIAADYRPATETRIVLVTIAFVNATHAIGAARGAVKRPLGALGIAAIIVAILLVGPVATLVGTIVGPSDSTWGHLVATVLPGYVADTLLLLGAVACGVMPSGGIAAWRVTPDRLSGR